MHRDCGGSRAKAVAWITCALAAAALALGMAGTAAASTPATRYVAPAGSDSGNDCLSQASPCATVQHAIDEAAAGDTVQLAAGTYAEQLTIPKPLRLVGPNVGVDPNTGSRAPEAVIDGGGGTAIFPDADGIAIEGLTISTTAGGFPIYASGAEINQLTIADDVVGSGVRAITVPGGDGTRIEHDRIAGDGYGIMLATGAYEGLRIEGNVVAGPVSAYGIFNVGETTTFAGLRLVGNHVQAQSDIGGAITHGVVSENSFDASPGEALDLQIDLHESTLTGNSFSGEGEHACLQLFGSQYGLDPSEGVVVEANSFDRCNPYAIQLSPEIDHIAIVGNAISDSYDGIATRNITSWDLTGRDIRAYANRIVGSTHLGVDNTVSGSLDARDNWWGCNAGPGAAGCDGVGGAVLASPDVVLVAAASTKQLQAGGSAQVTATLDTDSAGASVPGIPTGPSVVFSSKLGTVSPLSAPLLGGSATATFHAGEATGPAGVVAALDNQQVPVDLTVVGPPQGPAKRPQVAPRARTVRARGVRVGAGMLECGSSPCRVVEQGGWIEVGGVRRVVRVRVRRHIPAGGKAWVRIVLPKPAWLALIAGSRGLVHVSIQIADSAGNRYTRTIELQITERRH